MKAVGDSGAESIRKGGFQLQDRHRSTANYYKKYGDVNTEQLYGPGLYFGVVPPGQDPKDFAMKNCKDYAESWGDHIVLAVIKKGSRGLITGFYPEHPIWSYCASKNPYTYDQLEALGVKDLIGYNKNNTHSDNEWGYKLHDKIDFWAHAHNTRHHVVVYNPSVLQLIDQFECGTGKGRFSAHAEPAKQPESQPQIQRRQWPTLANSAPPGTEDLELEDL